MIPSPNLDDRNFEEIVDEAIRLIPQYCPQWTNFNKADPGITLLELFAWMTEMVIYRLNRVPDRNYLAFLNLLGIKLRPPQPARALAQFSISEKIDQVPIPAGTRVATKPADDAPALNFETDAFLLALTNRLVRCMSQRGEDFADNTTVALSGDSAAFDVFGGTRTIERFLYLGDARLEAYSEDTILHVRFEAQGAGEREFHELLEWEYWDGKRWRELERAAVESERNATAFSGPVGFEATSVDDAESFWIRGRLFEVPQSDEETVLDTISTRLEVLGEGVLPDKALCNAEGDIFTHLDLDKNFLPLGKAPQIDSTLYLGSDAVLGQTDSTVTVEVQLSDQTVADAPRASGDLVLRWEYFNGKRWKTLARCASADEEVESDFGFVDGTQCLTASGAMQFELPEDLEITEVNGEEARWIRCRVELGGYGVPGSYELADNTWVWKDDSPLRPPSFKSLTFKFQEREHAFERCLVYNDFVYADHAQVAGTEYKPFQAFQPVPEESPTLYLGWENPFPSERVGIYFHVAASNDPVGVVDEGGFGTDANAHVEQRVAWEYWNGKSWSPLAPDDSTSGFTQSGFVEFVGPTDARKSRRFGDSLYWMRVRLEQGGYEESPRVSHVLLNASYVYNVTTYGNTPIGSSQGTPNQSFRIPQTPVLDGEVLLVREQEAPRDEALARLERLYGDEALVEDPDGDGVWVRWQRVESTYDTTATDRVYLKNATSGEITFGDGVRGMIPPKGNRNIKVARYQVGGGRHGNVPAESIEVLKHSLAFVDAVRNPFPAEGGCDLETVEEVKLRAPHMIKARNRAVTAEDFEWLARESSNAVARVHCMPSTTREGEVAVIVIPKASVASRLSDKPVPTAELLKRVRAYLDERRLVGTVLNVVRPSYLDVSVHVEFVRLTTGSSDRIKAGVVEALERYMHPLVGGRAGTGWPFGRDVLKMDLYQVVEEVDGVDFVDKIRLVDEARGLEVEHLRLRADQLPHVIDVEADEKAHDRIV